jgi:hypothetical protein
MDQKLPDVAEPFAVDSVRVVKDAGQIAVRGVKMLGLGSGVLADFDLDHFFDQSNKVLSAHKTTNTNKKRA